MEEHFTASAEVHHEEQLCFRLERPIQLNNEWMINFFHYLSLINNRFYFLFSRQLVFPHYFHCVQSACIFFANKNNSTESTATDYFDLFEVVPRYFQLLVGQSVLSESQFCEMGPQKFIVLQNTEWSIKIISVNDQCKTCELLL